MKVLCRVGLIGVSAFCLMGGAQVVPPLAESHSFYFSLLPFTGSPMLETYYYDNSFFVQYHINACVPQTLQNKVYNFPTSTYSVAYSPNQTCSGTYSKGADFVAFGKVGTFGVAPSSALFSIDMNISIPAAITSTEVTTYNDGTSESYDYTATSNARALSIELWDAYSSPPPAYPLSDVASCSTNLGAISFESTYLSAFSYYGYIARLKLQPQEIEGRTSIPLHIKCNKPIYRISLSTGFMFQYSPDQQFRDELGNPTFYSSDRILIGTLSANAQTQSGFELKQAVIDPMTGVSEDGTSSPVKVPVSFFKPLPILTNCSAALKDMPVKRQILLTCQNKASHQSVSGCRIKVLMAMGDRTGGHSHGDVFFPRPLGKTSLPVQQWATVPASGLTFDYEAPELAGNVKMVFEGTDPDGATLDTMPLTLDIRNFEEFEYIGGLDWDITSGHDGQYGIKLMNASVQTVIKRFKEELNENYQVPSDEVHQLISGGASLPTGGLFDISKTWWAPHCGHRDGRTMDLNISHLTKTEKNVLKEMLSAYFNFPVAKESPRSAKPTHWHVQMRKKETKK